MSNSDSYPYLADDFARELIELSKNDPHTGPYFHYDREGDSIEFLAMTDSHDAERVSPLLTVYYSTTTGNLIGSKIKGVRALLKKYRFLGVRVKDGKVRLDHLILGGMFGTSDESPSLVCEYEKVYPPLMELLEQYGAGVEIPELNLAAG